MKPLSLALLLFVSTASFADNTPEKPPARWRYYGNTIDNASVCYNYKYGSVIYRNCRSYALEFFNEKCDFYKQREQDGISSPAEKKDKEMFCRAASTFSPVN